MHEPRLWLTDKRLLQVTRLTRGRLSPVATSRQDGAEWEDDPSQFVNLKHWLKTVMLSGHNLKLKSSWRNRCIVHCLVRESVTVLSGESQAQAGKMARDSESVIGFYSEAEGGWKEGGSQSHGPVPVSA